MNIEMKAKVSDLVRGIILLALALIIEVAIVFGSKGESDRVFMIIGMTVIVVLPVFCYGLLAVYSYVDDCKKIKKALETYGIDAINRHVATSTVKTYKKRRETVYFAEKAIIAPSEGVVPYYEIAQVYVTKVNTRNTSTTSLTIRTYAGETYAVCPKISQQEVNEFVDIIYHRNPTIILGFTDENNKKYDELVKRYKNGQLEIPRTTL